MFKITALLIIALFSTSCVSPDLLSTKEYVPLKKPVIADKVMHGGKEITFADMESRDIFSLLSEVETDYKVYNAETNLELDVGVAGASFGKGKYRIVSTYKRLGVFQNNSSAQNLQLEVSVNVIAELNVKKLGFRVKGVDLSSFGALSGSLNKNTVSGKVFIRSLGVNSPTMNAVVAQSLGNLDKTSLEKAAELSAKVETFLSDNSTKLIPHVVAIQEHN